ncbi:ROK family protein [bacterium]|nr:ROK family protein [bacterium]
MYITIDVGGTNIRIAVVVSLDGVDFISKPRLLKVKHDFMEDMRSLVFNINSMSVNQTIRGVGISCAGTIDTKKGVIVSARNLEAWAGEPFVNTLSKTLQCNVYLENDLVANCLGECYFGSTRGKPFDYLIWGTGINAGQLRYRNGNPKVNTFEWYENFESWEDDCGGRRLTETYKKTPELLSNTEWTEVLEKFNKHFGEYITKNDPPRVILGGSLALKHKKAIQGQFPNLLISKSSFGNAAGLISGVALLKRNLE